MEETSAAIRSTFVNMLGDEQQTTSSDMTTELLKQR